MNDNIDPHTPHDPNTPDFVCGMCANWYGGHCHSPDSPFSEEKRKGGAAACEYYAEEYHSRGWYIKDWVMHHKAVFGLVLAALFFGAVWLFTGDIFAALMFFEFLIEILEVIDF